MIGTTSFDGFSNGPAWTVARAAPAVRSSATSASSPEHALEAALHGRPARRRCSSSRPLPARHRRACARSTAPRIAPASSRGASSHTLVPIALAYVVAHYFSLLAYQGQAIAYLASDPLGDGSDLLRHRATHDRLQRASRRTGIWYVQVAALVLGHVAGLVARPRPRARRSTAARATPRARSTGCSR